MTERRARDIDFTMLRQLRSRFGAIYPRGRVVFHQNETSSTFFVVLQGSVEMHAADPLTGESMVVRRVGPGEFFGEMACFCERPRAATAITSEESVLLSFSRADVLEMLRTSPKFALGVIQTLCDRMLADGAMIARLSASSPEAHALWQREIGRTTAAG